MKLEEAITALRAGKKIRHKSWHKDNYFMLDEKGDLINDCSTSVSIRFDNLKKADDWEIVAEKKTYYMNIYKTPEGEITSGVPVQRKEILRGIEGVVKVLEFEIEE